MVYIFSTQDLINVALSVFRFLFRGAVNLTHRVQPEPDPPLGQLLLHNEPTEDHGVELKRADVFTEAKRLLKLVNVEALKKKLDMETGEAVARTREEAVDIAKVLDDAGVVLLFRDKVYLHPDKVVELVRRAVPLALTPEDDPRREELKQLQKKKEELDMLAHKQVRRVLWSGLGLIILQGGLFFRLTFWEFSWDVMEPITFFFMTAGTAVGYAYFLLTSRDPTYQNLLTRLFVSRRKKLYQRKDFDIERFKELQRHCKSPLDQTRETEIEALHAVHKN
ncbi:uncharacterized protein A4U43_C02F16650 [Asparagus officinalis]|uniref:Calcium uniporter protein C-terminal domain-containing protein n=1 Tax=Asparagus officinalis TaxID=4686 RepID=A0A5P1FKM6_ASPOF|nr:uncharacterized protein A4U43_C02F16650 [Asparagus officinalis]